MQVDNDELRDLCSQLNRLVENANLTVTDRCEFAGLVSELPSVQSFFNQVNELVTGSHGLKKLVKWHIEEGSCVCIALQNQCRAICLTDPSTQGDLNGTYDPLSSKRMHKTCLPPDMGGLGHGVKLPDGRLVRSFSSRGIPLTEEPLGQDVDRLAVAFAKFDSSVFADCADAWTSAGETLVNLADDVQKIANDVQGAGSKDAFTYEAGSGIRRWAMSLRQLGKQANTVSKHIDTFAKNYDHARAEVNTVADESDRAKRNATEEDPYNPAVYTEKANTVLREHYNPELARADTKNIEIPVPIRAFHPDDTTRLPEPPKPIPVTPKGALTPPKIEANPVVAKSVLAQPVVPPPDTTDIPKATPGKGMPPAETTPNAAHPLPPSQGSGVGSVSGPTSMASGTTPSPATPAGTTTAGAAGSAGHPSTGYLGGYPSHWNNPHQSPHKNRESRPHTNLVVGAGAFGTGLSTGSSDRVVPKGGALRAIPGAGQTPGTPGTNPNTPTSSGTKAPAGSGSPAKASTNPNTPTTSTGRPGTSGLPGTPGTGTSHNTTSKTTPRRTRRSAHNTERILPQPGNLPHGPIRHPTAPLYNTGH